MSWDVEPGLRCGPFDLSTPIDGRFVDRHGLVPVGDDGGRQTYRVRDGRSRVVLEDGLISDIECVESCVVEGEELIGLPVEALGRVFAGGAQEVRRWSDGDAMIEVEDLGLTFWIENGAVESVTVSPIEPG